MYTVCIRAHTHMWHVLVLLTHCMEGCLKHGERVSTLRKSHATKKKCLKIFYFGWLLAQIFTNDKKLFYCILLSVTLGFSN